MSNASPTGSVDEQIDAILDEHFEHGAFNPATNGDRFKVYQEQYRKEAREKLLQLILAREERFHDAFQRGERKGRRFEEFLEGAEWMKSREQMIEMLCLLRWHRSFNEVKSFPNDRALSEISDFMKLMDAIVDKEVAEKLQSTQSNMKENKEIN